MLGATPRKRLYNAMLRLGTAARHTVVERPCKATLRRNNAITAPLQRRCNTPRHWLLWRSIAATTPPHRFCNTERRDSAGAAPGVGARLGGGSAFGGGSGGALPLCGGVRIVIAAPAPGEDFCIVEAVRVYGHLA